MRSLSCFADVVHRGCPNVRLALRVIRYEASLIRAQTDTDITIKIESPPHRTIGIRDHVQLIFRSYRIGGDRQDAAAIWKPTMPP
jgi:hypothetical protein